MPTDKGETRFSVATAPDLESDVFTITLKINWKNQNGDGVWLLPDVEPVMVTLSPAYDYTGRFDYNLAVDQMESQLQLAWGMRLDLRQQSTAEGGVVESLRQAVLESLVRDDPDVLRDFSLNYATLAGESGGGCLPLVMAGSGYEFSIDCTSASEGAPDPAIVVESLAGAYGEVFQVPAGEVFSSSQRSDLLARASDWVRGLMAEAGLGWSKVEVDLESGRWVGNSLRLWINLYKNKVVKYALLIPVGQGGELDFAGIDQVAAEIARDLSLGREGSQWLCAKIAEQIGPDAHEYATWIIEVENNIRADFWEAMNRELAGHLRKAEELHEKANKWRKEYDEWVKASGTIEVTAGGGASSGAAVEFSVQLPRMPEEQKSSFMKIWDGLSTLPGAVAKGLSGKSGEMLKGLEFGFCAAGVVVKESAKIVFNDVFNILVDNAGEYVKIPMARPLEKIIGKRKAKLVFDIVDIALFAYGRVQINEQVRKKSQEFESLATKISEQILGVKAKLECRAEDK